MTDHPLLMMEGITCRFPGGIVANDQIDFRVNKAEVHALLGENGAGKSTLMKTLFGLIQPTAGRILWRGKEVSFRSAADAMAHGIGMVHQHFMLIPSFRVWENIILGHEPTQHGQIDAAAAQAKVAALCEQYGLQVAPDALVEDLSVGEQQRVEILKALVRDIDLLILDEPTAVLTPQEIDDLFATLQALVDGGLTIVFITHKLREVKAIATQVTILRRGKKIDHGPIDAFDLEGLAERMVGRPLSPPTRETKQDPGPAVLQSHQLCVKDSRGLDAIKQLDFTVHSGEVVGIAGVEGNGQSELLEALTGLRPITDGSLTLHPAKDDPKDPIAFDRLPTRERYLQGMSFVPDDRQKKGLVLSYTMQDNFLLGRHFERRYLSKGLWIDEETLAKDAQTHIEAFQIAPPNPSLPVRNLSGGNQQKVVVAREFSRDARLFIIAHPTRGVDIGAIESIHTHILQLQQQGAAILLFSSELPELLALSDRILVLYEGRCVGQRNASQTNETELGLLMTGGAS